MARFKIFVLLWTAFRQAGANPYLIRTIYCQLNRAEPNLLRLWTFLSSTSSLLVENRGTDEKVRLKCESVHNHNLFRLPIYFQRKRDSLKIVKW